MEWTSIAPPLISAASGLTGALIGAGVSAWTTRRSHKERLAADQLLAERKITADISLAEKKLALDRALAAWKRQAEFAEEILADFYKAREIIRAARSPASFSGEGETRSKEGWETEEDTRMMNCYYATTERPMSKSEFFSQLFSRSYRFSALFGQDGRKPFEDLARIRLSIFIAVRGLISTQRFPDRGSLPESRKKWEDIVWDTQEDDRITNDLNAVVEAVERICQPVIQNVDVQ